MKIKQILYSSLFCQTKVFTFTMAIKWFYTYTSIFALYSRMCLQSQRHKLDCIMSLIPSTTIVKPKKTQNYLPYMFCINVHLYKCFKVVFAFLLIFEWQYTKAFYILGRDKLLSDWAVYVSRCVITSTCVLSTIIIHLSLQTLFCAAWGVCRRTHTKPDSGLTSLPVALCPPSLSHMSGTMADRWGPHTPGTNRGCSLIWQTAQWKINVRGYFCLSIRVFLHLQRYESLF